MIYIASGFLARCAGAMLGKQSSIAVTISGMARDLCCSQFNQIGRSRYGTDHLSGRSISTSKVLLKVLVLSRNNMFGPSTKMGCKHHAGSWKSGLIVLQYISCSLWWNLTRSGLLEWPVEQP